MMRRLRKQGMLDQRDRKEVKEKDWVECKKRNKEMKGGGGGISKKGRHPFDQHTWMVRIIGRMRRSMMMQVRPMRAGEGLM